MGNDWQYVNLEHQKLWNSMERVWKELVKKNRTFDDPTYKALSEGKPYDYYWSERFKGWLDWPMRYSPPKTKKTSSGDKDG